MAILRIEWEAKASGVETIDLDELDLSKEEWDSYSYDKQLSMVDVCLEGLDPVFPIVDKWEVYEK